MFANWRFLQTLVSNVEMALAKTDMDIAARYVQELVPSHLHGVFDGIREEYERTMRNVKALTGQQELAGEVPGAAADPAGAGALHRPFEPPAGAAATPHARGRRA